MPLFFLFQESYIEIQTEYLPNLLHHIINSTTKHCSNLTDSETFTILQLCSKVLSHVQPSMVPVSGSLPGSSTSSPKKTKTREDANERGGTRVFSDTETEVSITSVESEGVEVMETVDAPVARHLESEGVDSRATEDKDDIEGVDDGDNMQKSGSSEGGNSGGSPSIPDGGKTDNKSLESETDDSWSKSNISRTDDRHDGIDSDGVGTVSEISMSNIKEKFDSLTSISEQNSKLETVMQACTQSFRELFCVVFMQGIIKKEPKELEMYIKTLYTTASFWDMQSSQESSEGDESGPLNCWDRKHSSSKIRLGVLSEDVINAFKSGCHLLMEFSSFPLYCWNSQKLLQDSFSKGIWLKFIWINIFAVCKSAVFWFSSRKL